VTTTDISPSGIISGTFVVVVSLQNRVGISYLQ